MAKKNVYTMENCYAQQKKSGGNDDAALFCRFGILQKSVGNLSIKALPL